jgi:hypothetical protein
MKVFWSWQSDTVQKNNHYFVRDALKSALDQVTQDLALDEASRPEIDHDTLDVPGLAPITDTIFDKIDAAAVFVADLTYVGVTADKAKLLPNPNVLIELGYALKSLGHQRIVLVANSAYGSKPESLPFDLRHRRAPITFNLPPGATNEDRARARNALVAQLTLALQGCLKLVIAEAQRDTDFPKQEPRQGDRSVWFPAGVSIENVLSGHKRSWIVQDVPRFYMRVIPKVKGPAISSSEVQTKHTFHVPGPWRDGYPGVNRDGVLVVGCSSSGEVSGAAQWFKSTGELWAFSNAASFERGGPLLLAWGDFARTWKTHLDAILEFMSKVGVTGPLMIEAGATNLSNVKWPDMYGRGAYSGVENEAYFYRTSTTWSSEERYQFIADTLSAIAENYVQPPISIEYVRTKA